MKCDTVTVQNASSYIICVQDFVVLKVDFQLYSKGPVWWHLFDAVGIGVCVYSDIYWQGIT